ncbi:hypothetical protein F5878DRAFT_647983 [Lentinula raphanica]|uniref:Uncharacterized protein n=1 Tax=Lentinula raphanica TaxID=153919 RepID=A0AA38NUU5_9AGAR|nr:hypothetical protein F5878DRAFT_647983 [Lentinula raphanica]
MSNQPIQKSNRGDDRLPSPNLPASFLEPLSPGKVLEAIASEGGVAESMHSPVGLTKKSRVDDATIASTGPPGINKDKETGNSTTSGTTTGEDVSETGPQDAIQPRRSGRKTSAPTIIQPLTTQPASKARRGRNVQTPGTSLVQTPAEEARQDETTVAPMATMATDVQIPEKVGADKSKGNKGKRKGMTFAIYPLPLQAHTRASVALPPPPSPRFEWEPSDISAAPKEMANSSALTIDDEGGEGDGDVEAAFEAESQRVIEGRKTSLHRPVSPFDGAHSSDEEIRHIVRASVLSSGGSRVGSRVGTGSSHVNQESIAWKLGKIPRLTRTDASHSPPPASGKMY